MMYPQVDSQRKGRLKVMQCDLNGLPRVFYMIQFVPVRAEYLFAEDTVEYVGYSPFFAAITEGELLPWYSLGYKEDGNVDIYPVKS